MSAQFSPAEADIIYILLFLYLTPQLFTTYSDREGHGTA